MLQQQQQLQREKAKVRVDGRTGKQTVVLEAGDFPLRTARKIQVLLVANSRGGYKRLQWIQKGE